MKARFLIPIIFVFSYSLAMCQQTKTIIPPSPDAAAFGKYGNFPVSTYTGVPNIEIPLYKIEYRDVIVPIGLSYHASGVTVEEDASWVGLGWVLNVGGVITRTVRDGDDMQFANDGYSNLGIGNYGYRGFPYDEDVTANNFLQEVCEKEIDAEPDIFHFNFLGRNGRFVLEKGQNPSLNTLVGTPLNAEKIEIQYDKVEKHWRIRTSDGYSFYFKTVEVTETLHGSLNYGKGVDDITFDPITQGFLSYDDVVVSSWYLDKIITPLNIEVNYVYDTEEQLLNGSPTGVKYSKFGSARVSINEVKETIIDPTSGQDCYRPSFGSATKIFTKHVYLKEIIYPLGKVGDSA